MENISHANWISFIDEYRNLLSLLSLELILGGLFFPRKEKRASHYPLVLGGLLLFGVMAWFISGFMRHAGSEPELYFRVGVWYVFVIAWSAGIVAVLFRVTFGGLCWLLLFAYAIHHIIYVAVVELVFAGLLHGQCQYWLMLLAYATVVTVVDLILSKIAGRFLGNLTLLTEGQSAKPHRLSAFIFMVFFIASTFVNQHNAQVTGTINYLAAVSDLSNCLFVIAAQVALARSLKMEYDNGIINTLLENEKRQYETYRHSVDYVNIKAHDLRHELKAVMSANSKEERLRDLSTKLDEFDSFIKTGHATLDIILTDKIAICHTLNIELNCMAEADKLAAMEESDIYSLFGNILDNAIEHVKEIEDPEYRFIHLSVRPVPGGILIEEENPLKGQIQLVDGLPQTTKSDWRYHGFGTRSIRFITEKYGSELSISVENASYVLTCMIPV